MGDCFAVARNDIPIIKVTVTSQVTVTFCSNPLILHDIHIPKDRQYALIQFVVFNNDFSVSHFRNHLPSRSRLSTKSVLPSHLSRIKAHPQGRLASHENGSGIGRGLWREKQSQIAYRCHSLAGGWFLPRP